MLIHGDCLDVLPTLPKASVDMVFADLPYGMTCNSFDADSNGKRMDAKPINKKIYQLDMAVWWRLILQTIKKSGAIVLTGAQPFTAFLVYSNPDMFKYAMVWDKVRSSRWMHAKNMPLSRHEDILIFYRKKPTYNPQMMLRDKPRITKASGRKGVNYSSHNSEYIGTLLHYTHRYPASIISTVRDTKGQHPNQKPVALLEWLIRTYTNEGDTVLDPTCGSGTTAIAAINTNRKWVCIEKDATYHTVAARRIAKHQNPVQSTLAL